MSLAKILYYALSALAVLIVLTIHEYSHAYAAYKLGDPTAKNEGRLTVNPLRHIDPLGFVMIVLFGFGWAKPVPVRLQWFEKPKRDFALTAAAGPIANLLLALFGVLLYGIFGAAYYFSDESVILWYFFNFSVNFIYLNVGLAVFNLIPVPPLDGSRIVMSFLPNRIYFNILKYERVIMAVLFAVVALGIIDKPLNFAVNAVADPLMRLGYGLMELIMKIFA